MEQHTRIIFNINIDVFIIIMESYTEKELILSLFKLIAMIIQVMCTLCRIVTKIILQTDKSVIRFHVHQLGANDRISFLHLSLATTLLRLKITHQGIRHSDWKKRQYMMSFMQLHCKENNWQQKKTTVAISISYLTCLH